MDPRARRMLWGLLGAGLLIRMGLAFGAVGNAFDLGGMQVVYDNLVSGPKSVYSESANRWPYPSGFFPFILAAGGVADVTSLRFDSVVQIPQSLADLAIAFIVQSYLGRRGASDRIRLAAAGLVCLGPSFFLVSGYSGQIDGLAILPAVGALWLWEFGNRSHRAILAGVLIGVGCAIKTVPILMLVALLPTADSWRERGVLVGAAIAVPLVALAPFLAFDYVGTRSALRYRGLPGLGGLGLLAQPELLELWFRAQRVAFSQLTLTLLDVGRYILGAALGVLTVVGIRRRMPSEQVAALLWLLVYLLGVTFFFSYLVWGLPFFLMAGYIRQTAALQAFVVVPTLLSIVLPDQTGLIVLYGVWMAALFAAMAFAAAVLIRRLWTGGPEPALA